MTNWTQQNTVNAIIGASMDDRESIPGVRLDHARITALLKAVDHRELARAYNEVFGGPNEADYIKLIR